LVWSGIDWTGLDCFWEGLEGLCDKEPVGSHQAWGLGTVS